MNSKSEQKLKKLQKLLLKIPKGKVSTYKSIANKMNIHPRHAAKLLARNPFPDRYPCYVYCSTHVLEVFQQFWNTKKIALQFLGYKKSLIFSINR